ncbi:MAG: UDP-N-acetylmuramate dehydrogenase [Thermodesulfobacteriota bacterium]
MARHTSFRVGGPAEALVRPKTLEELTRLTGLCQDHQISYMIVGGGTNLLVRDHGIRGVVILLTWGFKEIEEVGRDGNGVIIRGMAGAETRSLCAYALRKSLEGMNFALGIPGTIGGAIMMNSGTGIDWISEVICSIEVLEPTGAVRRYSRKELRFSYRRLEWKTRDLPVILSGFFKLHPTDGDRLRTDAARIVKDRRIKQPIGNPSAGCFFRNPASGKSAGALIDAAGLKEVCIGGAKVSSKHANFIINAGNATAADILSLSEKIRKTVFDRFGVMLEPEVKVVGY